MIVVSSSEFHANQKNYLDQVVNGLDILITRGQDAFKITKATDDDALLSKEEFYSKVEQAISDVKSGKTHAMKPNETLDEFLDRMEAEGNV